MAVVLTLVQTKQIIYINESIQNTVQTIQNTVNTSTHITKTPTHNKTNTYTHLRMQYIVTYATGMYWYLSKNQF